MAISDTQKVDYLWKKIGYAATKTDTVANKEGYNEAIPSPLQIRGDKVMTDSGLIPGTIPVANTSVVSVYTTSLPVECTNDATASTNRTWKTNVTDWISPEFGSTYQVKVYVNLSNSAGNAASAGTQLFASGSGNNDEWFFDYQSGVLNFIGTSLPSGVSFTGKSVYVSGAEYTGGFGVSAPGGGGSVGNLTISNVTISANSSAVSSSANIIFSTTGTGAVQFAGNNAIGLPVGNIANRPTTVNAGYLRFNTEFETIEVWDGYEWVQTSGGVITSQVLSGDGSTAQFALSANTTTAGVLVSINGTIQKPSTAYTVSNNTITFTETPLTGDSIEVRKLAGGTISVNYGNADVATFLSTYSGLYSNVQALTYLTTGVAGNIIPSANVTYSLGSPTRQWKDLFVSNNTIYIGGIPLSIDASGNLLVNGSQVQGSGGSGTNYSNVNVSALITTNGLTNYSNTNVAAYTTTQGYTNYSNVNIAAYLSTNSYLTTTTANLNNYAYTANITTANVGIIGYIDRANTIQSNQISAANLGIKGYVDNQITNIIGGAPGLLDTLGELANALGADANLSVTITSQIANVNANITTSNSAVIGYVDNKVSTANTAMKGYVDSVATLSSYSNVNVSALITTNGLTNYSNVNVIAYLAGNITVGNITTVGAVSAGNLNATNITVNGQPTTYGYVNGAYLLAQNTTDQSVGLNGVVNFQTTNASNGSIINKISNSQVTLTAGNTYKLEAIVRRLESSSTWGAFRWYDVTNAAYVGIEGFSEVVTGSSAIGSTNVATAYVTPSVNTTYELRQTTVNTISVSANYASIEIIQVNPTIAVQATVTGTINNQYASITNGTDISITTGVAKDVTFDTVTASSGIPYSTSTGVFTLTSGVTYRFTGELSFAGYTGYALYQLVDATTNTPVNNQTSANPSYNSGFAEANNNTYDAIYTPSTNQTVKFRVTGSSFTGTGVIRGGYYGRINVQQINNAFALNALDTMTTTGNVTVGGNLTVTGNISATGSILAVPTWISAGNITITATTTNPTKGTTTYDNISYRQLGAKQWEVVMTYIQTATNGTAGSGDYLVTLPNGLSFDTTLPSQQITTTNIGTNTYALMTFIIPSGSGLINQGSVGGQVYPLVYNATKFRILTTSWNSAIQCWGSGYYSTIDVPKIQLTFRFTST